MSTQINRVSDINCNQLVNNPKAKVQLKNRAKSNNPIHFNDIVVNLKKAGHSDGPHPSGTKPISGQGINPIYFDSMKGAKLNPRLTEPTIAQGINPIYFDSMKDAKSNPQLTEPTIAQGINPIYFDSMKDAK